MDARSMTPEQLRELAAQMEEGRAGADADEHERRISVIRGDKPAEAGEEEARPGNMRRIEVDGIPLDIDMRAVSDIRTLRAIGEIQKGGNGSTFAAVELFDRILGDCREAVEAALSDEDGYCPADAYCDFAVRIFEAVGAKN